MSDHPPVESISAGIRAASQRIGPLRAVSRFFATPAFPKGSGPDFVNAVFMLETGLGPDAVLAHLHAVEAERGRVRATRWGARTLDLDLIAQGAAVLPDRETQAAWRAADPADGTGPAPDRLILPHPRLQDRAFVLIPLLDIDPNWRDPVTGRRAVDLAAALPLDDRAAVTPL